MTIGLLVAGIGLLLVGLLAIGFGIPVKEFSFGNTLILIGTITACTGVISLGLWAAVRELNLIAGRLGQVLPSGRGIPPWPASATSPDAAQPAEGEGPADLAGFGTPMPRPDELTRDRGQAAAQPEAPAQPPTPDVPAGARPRRNLLFSSTSRKERERAEARAAGVVAPTVSSEEVRSPPPAPEPRETPVSFDEAWPQPERARSTETSPASRPTSPPVAASPTPGPERRPPTRSEEQPPVTVLKSGVVDGMAYSLYSDGSIEAQMPEGMMRFASIDALRSHLDQRP